MTGTPTAPPTAPWSWRQRERADPDGPLPVRRRNGLRLGLWGVMHFLFYFLQQIAELLAPLLLVVGIGWWSLPRIVAAVTTQAVTNQAVTTQAGNTDSQARDILNTISGAIPSGMHLAGYWVTPGGLVALGLLMMAGAAVGATLSALAARGM